MLEKKTLISEIKICLDQSGENAPVPKGKEIRRSFRIRTTKWLRGLVVNFHYCVYILKYHNNHNSTDISLNFNHYLHYS